MKTNQSEDYLIDTKSDADLHADTAEYIAWCMKGILTLTRSAVKAGEIDAQTLEPVLCVLLDHGTDLEDNLRMTRAEIEKIDPPRKVPMHEALERIQAGRAAS